MVVLDTDFIVAILRNNVEAVEKLRTFENDAEQLCITSITAFELLRGVQLSDNPETHRGLLVEVIRSMYVLDFSYIEADTSARIDAELMKKGKPIGELDVMIAGSCLTTSNKIVTRNLKYFKKIPELTVETW